MNNSRIIHYVFIYYSLFITFVTLNQVLSNYGQDPTFILMFIILEYQIGH